MSRAKIDFTWEDIPERHIRIVTLNITEWTYKVFSGCNPSLFQFDGVVSNTDCKGLNELMASGSIEFPHSDLEGPISYPHGHFHVGDLNKTNEPNYFHDPYIGVRLFASRKMQSELFRLFSVAFTSNNAYSISFYLKLTLSHPRGAEPEFWRNDWHKADLYIDYELGFNASPNSRGTIPPF